MITISPLFQQELIETVIDGLDGRICLEQSNINYLAWVLYESGDGDHLEIGTLHGGSAVVAGLMKVHCGYSGDIWCVDPLDGYYMGTPYQHATDWVSKIPVTPKRVCDNARHFGLDQRIKVVQSKSLPWPADLPSHFASVFIDGDHWGDVPWQDWLNVKDHTGQYVIFDNVDASTHPAVWSAVEKAAQDPDWELVFRQGITGILKRRPA